MVAVRVTRAATHTATPHLVFSRPGALPAAALEQVVAAVEGLDMDDVRATIAAKTAAAKR